MRGHEAIVAARLAGLRIDRVEVERLDSDERPATVVDWRQAGVIEFDCERVGLIEILPADSVATLDLRCCHGLPVLVLASSYERGWPIAERVIDVEPASLNFAAPDMAARYADGRVEAWEL